VNGSSLAANGPRLYVYKLTTDNGGAPHVKRGLLSLAICKPSIRRTAQEGDWIFGFGGNGLAHRLIYIARITERVPNGCYYVQREYKGRGDCIYRRKGTRFVLRKHARYHTRKDERNRDLGVAPRYDRATVLLSADFRYWGEKGSSNYQTRFRQIAALLERLTRGHRVNVTEGQRSELVMLQQREWRRYPGRRVLGAPSQTDYARVCNRSEGAVMSSGRIH
jgi:hypothetical protein